MVICLERDADLHVAQLMHCHLLSLASVKSRLVSPFWYRLTRVVPEKGPLNGSVCYCPSKVRVTVLYRKCSTNHAGVKVLRNTKRRLLVKCGTAECGMRKVKCGMKTVERCCETVGKMRYDTRCYFNVRSKADISQLNLPHGNQQLR